MKWEDDFRKGTRGDYNLKESCRVLFAESRPEKDESSGR